MKTALKLALMNTVIFGSLSSGVSAATVTTFTPSPGFVFSNSYGMSGDGDPAFVGAGVGDARDPFSESDTTGSGNAYYLVRSGDYLTWDFTANPDLSGLSSFSMLWGSPDTHNTVEITTSAGTETVTPPSGGLVVDRVASQYVNIAVDSGTIQSVMFTASGNSFEFALPLEADKINDVPEIDAGAGMGSLAALGAVLAFLRTRRRHS